MAGGDSSGASSGSATSRGSGGGGRAGGSAPRAAAAAAPAPVTLSPAAVAESRLVCDLLADALAAAEAALLAASGINCTLSGSTASVLLLRAGAVHLVNVGDSRVVLAGLAAGSAGGPRDH